MKRRLCLATALTCGMVLLSACTQQESPQASAAADTTDTAATDNPLGPGTIEAPNGTPVNVSLFRYYVLTALKKQPSALSDQQRDRVLDSLANLQLLANAAHAKGIDSERTVAVQLALQRMQVLAGSMLNRYIQEHPATEEEIKAAYTKHLPALAAPQYKARNILVKTEEDAEAVIADLNNGADFAKLASKKSIAPTAKSGGELGWFSAASMAKPVVDAIAALEVGDYSTTPIKSRYGWHVILLEDKKETTPPSLEQVHDQMAKVVNQQKAEAFIKSLRAEHGDPSAQGAAAL